MLDVYRRADVARLNVLAGFALAALLTAVVLLAGGSINLRSLLIWVAFVAPVYAYNFSRRAEQDAQESERLASPRATKLRFLRQLAVLMIPMTILFTFVAALSGEDWFLLPGVYLALGIGSLVEWSRMARWDRAHPGAFQVTDMYRWRPQRSVLRRTAGGGQSQGTQGA
jgi:hypothetical protein